MRISVRLGQGEPSNKTYGNYVADHFKTKVERHGSEVTVHFDYAHHATQDSGEFVVSVEEARRLGWALLRASMDGVKEQEFEVQNGKISDTVIRAKSGR